jgi:hypothetical protein
MFRDIPRIPKRSLFLLILLGIVLLFALSSHWLGKQHAIDECLDSGGCWDYSLKRCEREQQTRCRR